MSSYPPHPPGIAQAGKFHASRVSPSMIASFASEPIGRANSIAIAEPVLLAPTMAIWLRATD
jgi:hypothetical protein